MVTLTVLFATVFATVRFETVVRLVRAGLFPQIDRSEACATDTASAPHMIVRPTRTPIRAERQHGIGGRYPRQSRVGAGGLGEETLDEEPDRNEDQREPRESLRALAKAVTKPPAQPDAELSSDERLRGDEHDCPDEG